MLNLHTALCAALATAFACSAGYAQQVGDCYAYYGSEQTCDDYWIYGDADPDEPFTKSCTQELEACGDTYFQSADPLPYWSRSDIAFLESGYRVELVYDVVCGWEAMCTLQKVEGVNGGHPDLSSAVEITQQATSLNTDDSCAGIM